MSAPLRVVASEGDSLEHLLTGVLDQSHRFALELVGDEETAVRLMQEGASAAQRAIRRDGLPAESLTWFLRILGDVFLARFAGASPAGASVDSGVAVRTDDAAGVLAAFQELAPRDRLVNALYFAADLGYEEMARVLGLPVAVVRARLHRGRRTLLRLVGGSSARL